MSRLQPHFDKVVICEQHFPWYRHDFIDNTVDPDGSNFRLSRPKMAGPRSNIMREVRSQHERFLRVQLLFVASRQQQPRLIRFDFIFHTGTVIVQLTDLDQIIIHQCTDQEGMLALAASLIVPA